MRVLQLGPFPPPYGGVQTNLVAIRRYLRARGIGCAVINLNRYRRPDFDEVYFPRRAADVLRLLMTIPADIVHVHHGGNVTGRLVGLWGACLMLPNRKTVLTFHSGGYPSSAAGRTAHAWTLPAWMLRRFDAIIAVNSEIAAFFGRIGVREDRLQVICPYAFPEESAEGSARPVFELPERLRVFADAHDPWLLSVGGLEPAYDLERQIEMLGRLRRSYPRAGLVIAGSGSLESALRAFIRTQSYAADVLLYGDMPHPVTLAAMAHAAVCLRLTLYDGDSIAVREALHLGTPIVATDNRMRPPGVILVPKQDPAAWLDAIIRVIESRRPEAPPEPERWSRLSGEAGAPRLAGDQTRPLFGAGEENLEAVLRVYERVLSEPPELQDQDSVAS